MRLTTLAVLFALLTLSPIASASEAPVQPWVADTALLKSAWDTVGSGGIRAIEPRVADLEKALAGARQSIALAAADNKMLADGAAESLMLMLVAAGDKDHPKSVTAIDNPYPQIAMLLGSYYNEIGRHEDALRALQAGVDATAVEDAHLGETYPMLKSESGAAYAALHRWPESLAAYDAALEAVDKDDAKRKALLQRGRGYALTELNRLDDAEAAYTESLKLDPGNALALHELEYIKGLKAGRPETPAGGLLPLQPPPPSGNPGPTKDHA